MNIEDRKIAYLENIQRQAEAVGLVVEGTTLLCKFSPEVFKEVVYNDPETTMKALNVLGQMVNDLQAQVIQLAEEKFEMIDALEKLETAIKNVGK